MIWKKENFFVNFNFKESSESNNGTGLPTGQIPELLFYLPSLDNELIKTSSTATSQEDKSSENLN